MECRTALAPGERCDAHPKALTLDLADPAQRTRALDVVWGPPHLRARRAAQVGAAGGTAGGLFEGCSLGSCGDCAGVDFSGEALVAILVIAAAAIVAVLLYFLIKRIVYAIRAHNARVKPTGSRWQPPRRPLMRGTIQHVTATKAPLSGTECAAWSIVVTEGRSTGGPIMLRDGGTAGFTLALEDGRTVAIPAGRIRVTGRGEDESIGESYLASIDPSHTGGDATPVIPVDDAREVRLAAGDKVLVFGGLGERFDTNVPTGYRDAPPTIVVVEGVPVLGRD